MKCLNIEDLKFLFPELLFGTRDVDAVTNLCWMEEKLRLSVLYKEIGFHFQKI